MSWNRRLLRALGGAVSLLCTSLGFAACDGGSQRCGPELADPPGCTVKQRGECPSQDQLACCRGAILCARPSCPQSCVTDASVDR